MASKKKVVSDEELTEQALTRARGLLEEKGVVPATKLGPTKVRSLVLARLMEEGFEAKGKQVRVPLPLQGAKLLALGHPIPLTSFQKRLSGASATEAKQLALRIAREGGGHLVLRGKQLSLFPHAERVVGSEALRAGLKEFNATHTWLKKACSDKTSPSVLFSDLHQALDEITRSLGSAPNRGLAKEATATNGPSRAIHGQPRPEASPLGSELRGVVLALRDEDSLLAPVPSVSRRLRPLASPAQVKELLISAFRRGDIELRPEGGIGRLSEDEASLCPEGAGGVPLSWVRLVEDRR